MRHLRKLARRTEVRPQPPVVDAGRNPRAVGDWIDNGDGTWSCWDGEKAVGLLERTPAAVARTRPAWRGDIPVRVPADMLPKPRLHVHKDPDTGAWRWDVWEGCRHHGGDEAASQPAALALGLAALDTATVRSSH